MGSKEKKNGKTATLGSDLSEHNGRAQAMKLGILYSKEVSLIINVVYLTSTIFRGSLLHKNRVVPGVN